LNAGAGIRVGGTGAGTLNINNGTIFASQGINIARIAGSFGTNNLNGGMLSAFNIGSSTGTNAVFNFNGGTLQANFTPPAAWFSGGILTYVQAGGAIIDSSNNNVTISVPLQAGTPSGGLTKKGTGTLTLTGTNTFTGGVTNTAGTLFLNSPSTYAGGLNANGGILQMTTANTIPGATSISNSATLAVSQIGSGTANLGNLTFNGGGSTPGATLSVAPTLANNPAVALVNCSTLTLNGTNSISLPVGTLGTIALIKYNGAIAGSGNCTNLILPQGALGFISNSVAASTIYAVITSTGPGIVWTGTNSTAGKTNLWDISSTTNWVIGTTPTAYRQVVVPGDLVTFSDVGSGVVTLNINVGPASLTISNNSKNYTFGGTGNISGPTSLLKLGTGTATLNLTNNNYTSATVVSNGTLQVGSLAALSAGADVLIGPSGKLELAGFNQSAGELTGSGIVDNNSGSDLVLTFGTANGGTWNGSTTDGGHGGVAWIKRGNGTWVVGGNNRLGNGSPFINTNIFLAGTTIITNGGSVISPRLQTGIGFGGGSSATVIMGGGTLAVSNDVLAVGFVGGTGTLIVNSGTVVHAGGAQGAFGAPNNLIVGAGGGTGTLIVNGGQVLNSQALWLGQNAGGSGTLYLGGGLVQATIVQPSGAPATSIAYFNGGTLQASANSGDLLQVTSMIMSNGLVLDDGGFSVNIVTANLQPGDAFNGGVTKQGAGTLYFDTGNTYTGTTTVTGGTLAGIGSVTGPVVVAPGGAIGAGGAAGVGTFTINSNLTINGKATLRINKNGGVPSSDLITGLSTVTYGGTLVITNTTSDSTALVAGDTFTLFSATTHAGNFASIVGSPGGSLGFSFANGVLTVISTAANPTNITFSVSGSTLTLSWPADHLGWYVQSNSVSIVNSGAWFDVPGSQSGTSLNVTVNPAQPQIFFRMRHP
jgi:autotransporter-associated beta strand protein